MEINDVRSVGQPPEVPTGDANVVTGSPSSAGVPSRNQNVRDAVKVDTQHQSGAANFRAHANDVIGAINITSEAAADIGKLVQSIGGIAELAKREDLSPNRRAKLEAEANQLIDEIKQRAQTTESNGVRPLIGDKIRFEIEEKFGKALDIVFPDAAKEAFGLGQVSFSPKESIIDTLTKIESAEAQLNELRESVNEANDVVRTVVDTVEVTLQNQEAATASVRNVDDALELTGIARAKIAANPGQALGSAAKLQPEALNLTK